MGLYEEHRSNLERLESEADKDYIVVPRAPPREGKPRNGDPVENAVMVPLDATGEEACQEGGEECDTERTGVAEDLEWSG